MKKDEQGRLIFKNGFFIRNLWGYNLYLLGTDILDFVVGWLVDGAKLKRDIIYPKNLCSLFWGTVFAPFFWLSFIPLFIGFFLICTVVLLSFESSFILVALFFGFIYRRKPEPGFHRYKRYGKDNSKKMRFAPWEIASAALILWLIVSRTFLHPRRIATFLISTPLAWILAGAIILIFLSVMFFRSNAWKTTREFVKAKKQKFCPLVLFEDKNLK